MRESVRRLALALALFSGAAWASGAGSQHEVAEHTGHAGSEDNVAEYIFHHVGDDTAYEFELPGPLYTGHNPRLDLAVAFSFLRLETKPGACPSDLHADTHSFTALFQGCVDLRPTKHVLMMWFAGALLILAMLFGSHRNKAQLVPRGMIANLFELLVLFVRDELAIKNIGKEEGPRYVPYLLTAFFFILFMNVLGLFPWMATATGNLAVTAGLAFCTFVLTQVASIRAAGLLGYFKHLTGGVQVWLWPIMIPVEVLGLFTKPFALTVRLFANMLAGHIVIFFLLGLIFLLHPGMAAFSVPLAIGIYFLELFVALVQAYIFTMLSALFIGMGVAMGHHGEAHAAGH
ncbi:MAG: F0F1 ATP synthase subunit A [Myxococcales bacterium]|nr:F0F1 ATP synthase subunit A [Myxococcales bacterium]